MFDHIAPNVFWPLFMLFWLIAGLGAAYAFGKFVDAGNPMRHTRRVINGRKAMATDWHKPKYLPENWE
jgi:hypothetical protein